jgi:N-acetylmuramoyl-L-alanine amidase
VRERDRRRTVAWAALALLLGLTALGGYLAGRPSDGPSCPTGHATVVLDPGHGGEDPGAVNAAYGLVESDLTLRIAERVRDLLEADGLRVALTRADDATGPGQSERGRIATACRGWVYVSIHLNSFGEPGPNYAKTFWGVAAKDAAFAATMQAALLTGLQPGSDLGDGGTEQLENGGLLRAQMPAALVEAVFLSHPAEAARLAAPDGARLEQIARAVAAGVRDWLGWPGGTATPAATPVAAFLRPSDPLLGPARGDPAAALAAAEARGATRLEEVRAYLEEVYRLGPLVGLDPAIAVAQSAHETGFWTSANWHEHLNPVGIGVTAPGAPSPTWANGTEAARGQLVHLSLYAAGEVPPDHPLAPYLALDPRYEAALAAGRAGVAPTIAGLTGTWATDPGYAAGIVRAGEDLFGD